MPEYVLFASVPVKVSVALPLANVQSRLPVAPPGSCAHVPVSDSPGAVIVKFHWSAVEEGVMIMVMGNGLLPVAAALP